MAAPDTLNHALEDAEPESLAELDQALLEAGAKRLVLDCQALDLDSGMDMARLVAWLKRALQRGLQIELQEPQQLVVHNLYRVDYYPHPMLQVVNLRQDEAYG